MFISFSGKKSRRGLELYVVWKEDLVDDEEEEVEEFVVVEAMGRAFTELLVGVRTSVGWIGGGGGDSGEASIDGDDTCEWRRLILFPFPLS